MVDLIDRNRLIYTIEKNIKIYGNSKSTQYLRKFYEAIMFEIKNLPKADTERHAYWIDDGIDYRGANWFKCSNCGRTVYEHYNNVVDEEYPYCHCGCKMKKEIE